MQSLELNTKVAFGLYGRHLEKSILRHNSSGDRLTETKFGMLMQNHMPMTTPRSKLKQQIEFQYGDRPFSQTKPEVDVSQQRIDISHPNLVCA